MDKYYTIKFNAYYLSDFDTENIGWAAYPTMSIVFKSYNKAYNKLRQIRRLNKKYNCAKIEKLNENEWASWAWNNITSCAI